MVVLYAWIDENKIKWLSLDGLFMTRTCFLLLCLSYPQQAFENASSFLNVIEPTQLA